MIIYKVGEADAGERWHPTLAQAKNCARAYKGTIQDVHAGGDGRDGMCAMLNEAEMTIVERGGDDAMPVAEQNPEPFIAAPPKYSPSAIETDQIESFILERASVAQVERIMAALGCPFGELAKVARK